MNTALLEASKAKIGLNPQTSGVLTGYFNLLAIKWAIEKANSLDGTKLAAALSAASGVQTNIPGVNLNWTATPSVHNGFPSTQLKECQLKQARTTFSTQPADPGSSANTPSGHYRPADPPIVTMTAARLGWPALRATSDQNTSTSKSPVDGSGSP